MKKNYGPDISDSKVSFSDLIDSLDKAAKKEKAAKVSVKIMSKKVKLAFEEVSKNAEFRKNHQQHSQQDEDHKIFLSNKLKTAQTNLENTREDHSQARFAHRLVQREVGLKAGVSPYFKNSIIATRSGDIVNIYFGLKQPLRYNNRGHYRIEASGKVIFKQEYYEYHKEPIFGLN